MWPLMAHPNPAPPAAFAEVRPGLLASSGRAARKLRCEIGNRACIDIGLVPFFDDSKIGRSRLPACAALPAVAMQEIGRRCQHIWDIVNEIAPAVAGEIDGKLQIFGRHELGLADFARPGTM